jgi:hypothetical protein
MHFKKKFNGAETGDRNHQTNLSQQKMMIPMLKTA